MARNILDEFLIALGYDVDEKSEKKATESVDKVSQACEKLSTFINTIAGAAVVNKLWDVISGTADKFDQLSDAANRIGNGTTVSDLSAFAYAVQLSGSSAEAAVAGYEQLSRTIGQASMGMGRAVKVFQQLGISLKDNSGRLKTTSQVWEELSTKLQGLDKSVQTGIITRLGLSADLVEALTSDLSGLQLQYKKTYEQAGVNIDEVAEKSAAYNDSLDMLKMTIEAVRDAIGARFLERGRITFDTLRRIIFDNIPKIVDIISGFIKVIMGIATAFIRVAEIVLNVVNRFMNWFNELDVKWKALMAGMAAAWLVLNSAFLKSPLGMLLSLITAIGLLIDDYKVWKEGGKSAIDWNNTLGKTILWLVNNPIAQFLAAVAAGTFIIFKFMNPIGTLIGLFKVFGAGINLGMLALKGLLLVSNLLAGALTLLGNGIISLASKIIPLLIGGIKTLSLTLLTTPIGWLITGIGLLIAAGYLLYKNWDTVSAGVSKVWDQACEKIAGWADTIKDIWNNVFNWFSDKFGWILDGISGIADKAGSLWNKVTDNLPDIWPFGDDEDEDKGLIPAMANSGDALIPPAVNMPKPSNNTNINQTNGDVNITINESKDPQETAQQIADIQQQVRSDQVRNMRRGMQ